MNEFGDCSGNFAHNRVCENGLATNELPSCLGNHVILVNGDCSGFEPPPPVLQDQVRPVLRKCELSLSLPSDFSTIDSPNGCICSCEEVNLRTEKDAPEKSNNNCECHSSFQRRQGKNSASGVSSVNTRFEAEGGGQSSMPSTSYCSNGFQNPESGNVPAECSHLSEPRPLNSEILLSPDMDFLDFDFDPGHSSSSSDSEDDNRVELHPDICVDSCDRDREADVEGEKRARLELETVTTSDRPVTLSEVVRAGTSGKCGCQCASDAVVQSVQPTTSHLCEDVSQCSDNADSDSLNFDLCGERLLRRENSLFDIAQSPMAEVCESRVVEAGNDGREVETDQDIVSRDLPDFSGTDAGPVERVMLWSEMEACQTQVSQIGLSACGATAVMNTLMALKFSHSKEDILKHVKTRLRADNDALAKYILSRSVAGSTHEDLIESMENLTEGSVYARFFPFFPRRNVSVAKWLSYWMKKDCVAVATLNLQKMRSAQQIPDAWHHQMIFGVGPKGVYLTNPLECVSEATLMEQLTSESVLLIRRADVLSRWADGSDLSSLITLPNRAWGDMNVLGQVTSVLREECAPRIGFQRRHLTSHVQIPAAYKAGITLFVRKAIAPDEPNPVYEQLRRCHELPKLD